MKKILFVLAALGLIAAPLTHAQSGFQQENMYFGFGLGMNSVDDLDNNFVGDVDYDDATGFQFFAGYELPGKMGDANLAVEVGYMDSGDFDIEVNGVKVADDNATGLWINGVATLPMNKEFGLLGRIGLDLGDDDGLMFGFGGEFKLNREMALRGEYVIRDEINSLQINFLYRL